MVSVRGIAPFGTEGKEVQGSEELRVKKAEPNFMDQDVLRIKEIREVLEQLDSETHRLQRLTCDIPGAQKNITPILAFIDILKFHFDLGDILSSCQGEERGKKTQCKEDEEKR